MKILLSVESVYVDVVTYLLLACKYQILPQSGEPRNKVRYKILWVWVL